jgi:malate dehydrogenase (oxaloacetate-decarboxylating)
MVDSVGLVHRGRNDVNDDQLPYAVDPTWFRHAGLTDEQLVDTLAIARAYRPTVLIGTTGQRGLFSRELVEIVRDSCTAPIIMPLSNPTDRAEARAEDLLEWTGGRALVATGSPSPDVPWNGASRTIGQANNAFIFPGVGLGAIIAEARSLPDDVFVVAAQALAALVSRDRVATGSLYPPVTDLRIASRSIAIATVTHLRDCGYGSQLSDEEIPRAVDAAMWRPDYLPYEPRMSHRTSGKARAPVTIPSDD